MVQSVGKIKEILDYELPKRGDPDFQRMLSTQKDAAVAVVNSGLKADENRFRRRQTNILKDLYERMQQAKSQGPLIEA